MSYKLKCLIWPTEPVSGSILFKRALTNTSEDFQTCGGHIQ